MGCCGSSPKQETGRLAAADDQPKLERDGPSLEKDYQDMIVKKIGDVLPIGTVVRPSPATKQPLPSTEQTSFGFAPKSDYKGGSMIFGPDGVFGVIESVGDCTGRISSAFESLMTEDIRLNTENLAEALKINYSLIQQMCRTPSTFNDTVTSMVTLAVVQQKKKKCVSFLISDPTTMAFIARQVNDELQVVCELGVDADTKPCLLGRQEDGGDEPQPSPTILSSEFMPGDLFVMMKGKLNGDKLKSFVADTFYADPALLLEEVQKSANVKSAFVIVARLPGQA